MESEQMLTHLDPASALAVGLLIFALVMVVVFEATNGFHDAANAVATVIYTKSLQPTQAVVWSGLMNFLGVIVGGIAVAYALVELLPAEVLSPPDGGPAVAMLIALFVAALFWNILTWWFGLPNSSSHCLIGALIGVALGNALVRSRSLGDGVHWHQVWTVLEGLALSPILGFILAGGLYRLTRKNLHDPHLYEPAGDRPPVWWMRGILIFTCTGVSFAHGTNDGQKSIGLIMLTIIGLFPATYALNPDSRQALNQLPQVMSQAQPLIQKYGDDEREAALQAAQFIQSQAAPSQVAQSEAGQSSQPGPSQLKPSQPDPSPPGRNGGITRLAGLGVTDAGRPVGLELGLNSELAKRRANIRDDVYQVISQLKLVEESNAAGKDEKKQAQSLVKELGRAVEYAPWWVRILSAVCLGIGTMIGYKRIVTTLGERLGNIHLTPAQGAAAEVVSAALIGFAGFTGLPVSTTHIVTSGIGGTMVTAGAGLRYGMISRILMAWVLTLPVTILIAGGLYYLLANPGY
jgi:PiT family inorganic phosphate transporter